MGKILDTLRRAEPKPHRAQSAPETIVLQHTQESIPDRALVEDPMPFIEVGGKDKPGEASPDVLAFGPVPSGGKLAPPRLTAEPSRSSEPSRTDAAQLATPTLVEQDRQFRAASLRFIPVAPPGQIEDQEPLSEWLIAYHEPQHPASRQFQDLLAGLRKAVQPRKARSQLFVALARNIGSTTALLNLAITAARAEIGQVLVVDGNFANPGLARLLKAGESPGLKDVLSGRIGWEQAVQGTRLASLFLLPAGRTDGSLACQSATSALAEVFRDMSRRFSMIFVDGPRWGEDSQVLKFCMACDCVFPVVPHDRADEMLTHDLVQRLGVTGSHVAGAILTQP